ncbi:hypothetical protein SAMN05660484_02216 [Eubacterium ruminantium]|uniref:Uncharacterized protein n=1 Tax=Eubacterium ruminantium TaxID=42322 RepID=A0A1T4Q528_9FIRM|nr:hypothetical protein [Eubacterium ruminantium]SCW64038.1 hypothetical protein SAMN05660484_02216 [Eubacterium ruminantium]SDN31224.1 hypothetical protein SAMN04490370_11654 [Eubacterium ruminantium]SJZ98895.1 hypothetical protein SAMN02745110_02267 [Eubacterium ruminantium]
MSDLAREIVEFMETWDYYELYDADIEDCVRETTMELYNDRKGLADYLKDFVENANDDCCASEAGALYRRVVAL